MPEAEVDGRCYARQPVFIQIIMNLRPDEVAIKESEVRQAHQAQHGIDCQGLQLTTIKE